MAPIVHGLERDYAGEVGFVYLDVDDPAVKPLMRDLGYYSGLPTFVLLDAEGSDVKRWVGMSNGEGFARAFDALLAGEPIPEP